MAYARAPYGQNQAASPWSAGCPPGLQQQQQQPQTAPVQHMFNQPMGAFDISAGGWQQGQQQHQAAAQQWGAPAAMQQVHFVPNPAYMQAPPAQQQMRPHQMQQQQQQRPMHQRSLSAPRVGANGLKRPMNNSFGGTQQQQQHNNWHNNNRSQQNGNNHQQQRVARQQSRNANGSNQKGGQFNNNNNNNNSQQQHNNNNNNVNKQQNQQQKQNNNNNKQQQQQQQQQPARKGTVKVTRVRKQMALKAKHAASGGGKTTVKVEKDATNASDKAANSAASSDSTNQKQAQPKVQSKTAERKQLKLQARKNAEGLSRSKFAVAKSSGKQSADATSADEPIDQAQLKCVPAVFGFVCKLCDVFLRDKVARREHIDSEDHMEKFKAFEESEKAKAAEEAAKAAEAAAKAASEAAKADADKPEEGTTAADETNQVETVNDGESKPDVDAKGADNEAGVDTSEVKVEE